jgi:hypothetical protein
MAEPDLPADIAALADDLAGAHGVVAVVLGGSRASQDADAHSDWDLALVYRGAPDLAALAARGTVHPPGSWGRIMNGGAWLTLGGRKVDVLLRDLDVVEHWSERARAGAFEVDFLLSYLAGIPTYTLLAERALGVVLRGPAFPAEPYPRPLAQGGPPRWRFHRDFSLEHARDRARRGDHAGAAGQTARAAIEEAHARLCARGEWVLNEKRILERAGLARVQAAFADAPRGGDLPGWVAAVAAELTRAA